MATTKDEFERQLELFKDYRDFYSRYHNFKETMAWGGLVFVSLIFFATYRLPLDEIASRYTITKEYVSLGFLILSIFMMTAIACFVWQQLHYKNYAANIQDAAVSLIRNRIRIGRPFEANQFVQASVHGNDIRFSATREMPEIIYRRFMEARITNDEMQSKWIRITISYVQFNLIILMIFASSTGLLKIIFNLIENRFGLEWTKIIPYCTT